MPRIKDTKKKIFSAAIDCFSHSGYTHAKLEDIAAVVGIRAASIYHHYENKDAILQDILDYYVAHFNIYRTPPATVLGTADKLPLNDWVKMLFYNFGDDDEEYALIMKITKIILDLKFENDYAARTFRRCFLDEPTEYLHKIFTTLIQNGKMDPIDYEALTFQMVAFNHFLFLYYLVQNTSRKQINAMFMNGVQFFAWGLAHVMRSGV